MHPRISVGLDALLLQMPMVVTARPSSREGSRV